MKIKELVLYGLSLFLSPLLCVAQQGGLNTLFDELQQDVAIGAIVRLTKGETSVIATRTYFMDRLQQDTTMLNWRRGGMSPFSRDITKGFTIGTQVDAVIDPVSAGLNAKISSDNRKILRVAKGHEKTSEIGEIAYLELLDALDVAYLKRVEDAMKKGGKAYLVTRVFYVDSGYVDIVNKKNADAAIHAKIDSIGGNSTFNKNSTDSLNRTYNPNTAVAYKGIQITKKDIKEAFCRKGIAKGTLFVAGEGALIAGSLLSRWQQKEYTRNAHITQDEAKYHSYSISATNYRDISVGCAGLAAGLYLWNVIDGNTLQIMPYSAPENSGITLAFNF
jgi:hypothetical protein